MKTLPIKLPVFLPAVFFITGIMLLSCGEQSAAKTTPGMIDTSSTEVVIHDPVTDTISVIDHTADSKQELNTAPTIKDPVTITKTTMVKTPNSDPKAAPVTTVTTTTTTTVPTPVVIAEPVKPAPPVKPVPVEIPKPVTVATPTPVQTDWPVPANYRNMKSPYPADQANLALGKTVYGTHCKSCHGSKGDGLGPKASTLDTEMRSFSNAGFKSQSIGDVYYKTMTGRKDMPKFDKKIADDEEKWAVVNYIRSF